MICEIEGRVLGGMQFGVLAKLLFCELDGRVPGGGVPGGMQFGVLVEVQFCEIDKGHAVWGRGSGAVL